ncbi:hypothetical protein N0V95_000944 [Ascochyta clinopodiicola]|nr:hypothetical protein N0V95_000944 [Ascochyta clinopodiicola]
MYTPAAPGPHNTTTFFLGPSFTLTNRTCHTPALPKIFTVKMSLKYFLTIIFLAMAVFVPVIFATGSDRYDPFNHCGAPFCGSTGAAAGAGAVARMDHKGPAGDLKHKHAETLSEG